MIRMRTLIYLAVFVATFVCACATTSKNLAPAPPLPAPSARLDDIDARNAALADQAYESAYLASPSESMRALTRYRQASAWAKTDPLKACRIWLELAADKRFPPAPAARLRALESCPADQPGLPGPQDLAPNSIGATSDPWLAEAVLRASLKRAIAVGDTDSEMKLSAELASREKLQRDRVKLLERSLSLAREKKTEALAQDYQRQLEKTAPRFIAEPSPAQYLAVASDFRQIREFTKARDYFKKIVDLDGVDDVEKLRALDGIRMTYKLEKDTESYIKATQEYARFARERFLKKASGPAGRSLLATYLETQITLARAVWTEHDARGAEKILSRVEHELRGRHPIEESLFIRARIEEEAGRYTETLKLLEKADSPLADRATRAKIVWYRAWNLRKAGQLKEAAALLAQLAKDESGTPSLVSRDRFWLGKTLLDLKETEKAQAEFEWLIENDPMGYYGLLSYRELKRPIPPLGAPAVPDTVADARNPAGADAPADTGLSLVGSEREMTDWLIALGERDLARAYIDNASSASRKSYSEAQSLDLLKLYARAGSYQTLFARLSDLPAETRKRILFTQPDLLFPQPWKATVQDSGRKQNVPPELIYSIMRQESSFNPTARSHADAFGLMQLIPEMAKRASKRADLQIENHEDLYHPETNITLGAAFLRELLDHWKEQFVLTVASYNASERAIDGWIKTRFKGDPLQFIEDIPYEETRTYIKLVLRNFVSYSRLNSGGTAIEFPERCLENLQAVKP